MRQYIVIAMIVMCAATACKREIKEVQGEKFVLTDTMLAHTELAQARMQQVATALKLYGKVTAPNSQKADVNPVVGGNVLKVYAELGDYVKQGQVLAVIRSGEIAEYERQRLDAYNDVAVAEKNLQVANDMYNGKLTSEKDLILAQKELEKAKASLQRINEMYRIYKIGEGATYSVTAPISGFIIDKNVTENIQWRSDQPESMFSIAQISEVWVIANVNESDIGRVKQGTEALINTISYPDRVFRGNVDRIFNMLDENTKAMKARIVIRNDDLALKPEMSATVSLLLKEDKQQVAVPSSAIIFDKNKNWVMVYKGRDHIETREVEIYSQSEDTAYIKKGLTEGETVVVKNQLLIYDALND